MKIRKLSCFDFHKIKKMIPYLGPTADSKFISALFQLPLDFINSFLPLKFRFRAESYILLDNNEILAMATIEPTPGNSCKINITRLIFKKDFYNVGKQLINYIVSKYGANGASSFVVYIDQSHDELCDLFVNGCGFRQCSYENLWKLDNFKPCKNSCLNFRIAQDTDANAITDLYNSELNNLYKSSMERNCHEFREILPAGLIQYYKNRYICSDNENAIAYLSLTTIDNLNFIIDFSLNDGYEFDYDEIINFALLEISRRKKKYTAFLKHRQYTKFANKLEDYLHSRHLNCVQTQCVFVKDFYKPVKDTENVLKVFSFGEHKLISN